VINTVLYSYLIGWIITSVGLALTTRDQSRPASVIVAAGAVWPLLVLGAAVCSRRTRRRGSEPSRTCPEVHRRRTPRAARRMAGYR
jgi:hypothetical protein